MDGVLEHDGTSRPSSFVTSALTWQFVLDILIEQMALIQKPSLRSQANHLGRGARSTLSLILLSMVMALVLVACGDGSSATGDQGTVGMNSSTSKPELIKKADAICRQTDVIQKQRLAAYERGHPKVVLSGPAGEKALRAAVFPPIANEIKKIAALGSPDEGGPQLQAILEGWSRAVKKIEKKPSIVLLGEGPFARPDKLAAKYGFKDCAKAL